MTRAPKGFIMRESELRSVLNVMTLAVGQVVDGKVTGITKFGAFVELDKGIVGLVHISEIANVYVKDIHEHLTLNQNVEVKVISVGKDGKVGLSIKQVPGKKPSVPFEEQLSRFMKDSEERQTSIKKNLSNKQKGSPRHM